jgi:iron-sulfur cluster insertion protein
MSIQVSFTPMQSKTAAEPTVRFSDAAAARVKVLAEENKNPAQKLRVFVSGGGCSGFQYGFEFDENVNDGDLVVENNGATMLVDAMSLQYLNGAEIDFLEGLEGSRFVINNPNASTTCGCGASFSV